MLSVPLAEYDRAIQNYTRFDDWYLWVQMHKGTVSMPVFQSLEAFWPGLQVGRRPVENRTSTQRFQFQSDGCLVSFSLFWATLTAQ